MIAGLIFLGRQSKGETVGGVRFRIPEEQDEMEDETAP